MLGSLQCQGEGIQVLIGAEIPQVHEVGRGRLTCRQQVRHFTAAVLDHAYIVFQDHHHLARHVSAFSACTRAAVCVPVTAAKGMMEQCAEVRQGAAKGPPLFGREAHGIMGKSCYRLGPTVGLQCVQYIRRRRQKVLRRAIAPCGISRRM